MMAVMTSFHPEKCCHLVSAQAASTRRICSIVRQFLIRGACVLILTYTIQKELLIVLYNLLNYY